MRCRPRSATAGFLGVERGVEKRRSDAARLKLIDLILHQRDQRRNDDGQPARLRAGSWKQSDLPPPVGNKRENVFARESCLDDFALQRPKLTVAEGAFQK